MHPRALTCRLCQQQFFPASLKFHVQVCAKRQEHVELPCEHCDGRFLCTMLKVHMKFCEQRKRRARININMGLRSPDSTETRRQGGVGGSSSDTPSSMANSGPDQQQHPFGTPQTVREYGREIPPQAQSHDVSNSAPQGLGGNGDSISCGERLGDGRGHNENKDGNVVVTASDGRIACTNCQRRFSPDRVGVHQNICKRVNPPSARDTSERGKGTTARSKKARFASPRVEPRRRKSIRPVVGEIHAGARARGGRGRSVPGVKCSIKGGHAIDDARDRMCFSSEDHLVWRELAPTQAQANTNTMTPRASPPGIPRSAGAEYRGSFFSSSLDLEEPCLPQTEKPNQQQRHRRRGTPHRKESWDNNHRRARRPSSASGLASSSEDRGPLAPVERSRKRFSTGRAESTSCSPVRLRRGGMSATTATAEIRPARNEGLYARRRRSVVSAGGRRFGSGGGSEAEFARSSNTSRRGAAGRGVGSERLSGGMGFFSPSRDGGRVRLLR